MGHLVAAQDYRYQPVEVDGYIFIVNSNGSIQHSTVQYKEDGDVLIDAREDEEKGEVIEFIKSGKYKYALDPDSVDLVDFYVEELDPTEIMAIELATPSDDVATPSGAAQN